MHFVVSTTIDQACSSGWYPGGASSAAARPGRSESLRLSRAPGPIATMRPPARARAPVARNVRRGIPMP